MNPELRELVYRKISPDVVNTCRGVDGGCEGDENGEKYADILGFSSKEEMYEWLEGNTVLDIGSGQGLFAMDVMKEKGKDFAFIVSINPSLKDERFRKKQVEINKKKFTKGKKRGEKKIDAKQVEELLKEVRKRSSAASWDSKYISSIINDEEVEDEKQIWSELPFADESFDRIVSSYAFPYYSHGREIQTVELNEEVKSDHNTLENWKVVNKKRELSTGEILRGEAEEEIIKVLKSIIRVLKPGGECRLSPLNDRMKTSGQGILRTMIEKGLLTKLGAEITLESPVKGRHSYCLIRKLEKKSE